MSERPFLFEYQFQGHVYGLEINAATVEEAKQRLWAMTRAEYKGEVFARVRVPGGGFLSWLMGWGKPTGGAA